MPDIIIEPTQLPNEPDLPSDGLLFINPGDMAKAIGLLKELSATQHFLYNSNLHIVPANAGSNSFFVAGPAIGSPMAVLALEKLIALGAKRVTAYGSCGSIHPAVKIGDILLPNWGISEEGTSAHYPTETQPQAHHGLQNSLRACLESCNYSVHQSPIWTTDAPYRESRPKIIDYSKMGVMAVDMEFTALCTVAAFRNISFAAAMLISDELYHERWNSGFGSKTFNTMNRKLIEKLIQISPLQFQELR